MNKVKQIQDLKLKVAELNKNINDLTDSFRFNYQVNSYNHCAGEFNIIDNESDTVYIHNHAYDIDDYTCLYSDDLLEIYKVIMRCIDARKKEMQMINYTPPDNMKPEFNLDAITINGSENRYDELIRKSSSSNGNLNRAMRLIHEHYAIIVNNEKLRNLINSLDDGHLALVESLVKMKK